MEPLTKGLIGRRMMMKLLGYSKTHMVRLIKEKGLKPVEGLPYKQKMMYKISDVEEAFGVKLDGAKDQNTIDEEFANSINDILED